MIRTHRLFYISMESSIHRLRKYFKTFGRTPQVRGGIQLTRQYFHRKCHICSIILHLWHSFRVWVKVQILNRREERTKEDTFAIVKGRKSHYFTLLLPPSFLDPGYPHFYRPITPFCDIIEETGA